MRQADAAIVGAGPSGAWAAYLLARGGAQVLLFDHSHPREKPCGGGVTARALTLVAPVLDPGRLPSVAIERAIFEDASGTRASVSLEGRPAGPLVVTSRRAFDAALLDAAVGAGATLVADRVRDVSTSPGRATIETRSNSYAADWLIGADGANSLVRRRLWRPFRRDQLSIATGFFADGASGRDIVIRFTPDPPGYIWSFPRIDHLAIGICAQADAATQPGLEAQVAGWIAASGLAGGAPLRPYSWPIPSLSAADFAAERLAGPRWLLAGDAAGLVDPITREGIFFALESAAQAARAVLAGGDAAAAYDACVRGTIGRELAFAARLKRGFFQPPFIRLLLGALVERRAIRSVMADLVAGEQSYRTLARRLALTMEVRLAWRFLKLRAS